jgi:hypothetical protein
MRRFLLVVFSLLFIFTCSKDGVDQIKVNIPEGITVPEGMVYIPVGDFIMGHPDDSETEKGKVVTLEAFFIDRFFATGRLGHFSQSNVRFLRRGNACAPLGRQVR